MSTTARKAWLKVLRTVGVKKFRARSGSGLPFICHVGDQSGEAPFYDVRSSVAEIVLMSSWCDGMAEPVIFDIGANNGFIATQLAQFLRNNHPRIYAFEPVPSTFAQLQMSVETLGLKDMIFPICRAISDVSATVRIFFDPHQSLFAQVRDNTSNPRVGSLSVETTTTTVDELINSLGVSPCLMKVDVEGFEARVFRGAQCLLTCNNPPAICFEWNPLTLSELKARPDEIEQSLTNYQLYYIDDFEGQRMPLGAGVASLAELTWVCNMFAVPNSNKDRWQSASAAAKQKLALAR